MNYPIVEFLSIYYTNYKKVQSYNKVVDEIMNNTQSYKRVTTSIKVYYIVYKTTNRVNGKFYYGKHITLDPNDSYLGSGVALQQAIQQVGKQNFTRENIKFCSSEQEMNEIEKLYISSVKSDRKLRKRCYNIYIKRK